MSHFYFRSPGQRVSSCPGCKRERRSTHAGAAEHARSRACTHGSREEMQPGGSWSLKDALGEEPHPQSAEPGPPGRPRPPPAGPPPWNARSGTQTPPLRWPRPQPPSPPAAEGRRSNRLKLVDVQGLRSTAVSAGLISIHHDDPPCLPPVRRMNRSASRPAPSRPRIPPTPAGPSTTLSFSLKS